MLSSESSFEAVQMGEKCGVACRSTGKSKIDFDLRKRWNRSLAYSA
jgi:hypothetical protein